MRTVLVGALLAISAASGHAAPPKDIVQSFSKAAQGDADLAAKVNAIRQRVAVVLVPGILGSKLTSPSQGVIWGEGLPDLAKLALPAPLVDEKATSDVQATLLESYFGDQYGQAFTAIQAAAKQVGAKAIACGYDWRRDLRVGAADVERCIQKSLGSEKHILILVSHSMGGIVASVWNAAYEQKKYSPQHLVGGIAILGSPLAGSCEIIRMIHEGYKQPVENTFNAGKRFEYVYETKDMLSGGLVNALTGWATDGVRTALLTWPGAFELSPKMTKLDTEGRSCVPLRRNNDGGPELVSYFEPEFWTSDTGKDLLKGAQPPAHFPQVLAQAREFRDTFSFTRPRAPTYAYFSLYWMTPEQANLGPNGMLSDKWTLAIGDGRVPSPAGGSRPDGLSDMRPLNSVHGALPKDTEFQKHFLKQRLPALVSTLVSYRLMTELGSEPAVLKAYEKADGALPVAEEFRGGMDTTRDPAEPPVAKSALGRDVVQAAESFRSRLCSATSLCTATYAFAKQQLGKPDAAVKAFGNVLGTETASVQDKAAATAQLGIATFKLGNVAAAGHVLSKASVDLSASIELPSTTQENRRKLSDFKLVVDRNLATALRDSGQCIAAKRVLQTVLAETSEYRGDLKAKCLDRESALYQPLEDF